MPKPVDNPLPRSMTPLAASLLAKPPTPPKDHARECFSCGRRFISGDGHFCHPRCRAWFDAGNPPYDPNYASKSNSRWYSLPMGPTGFYINCAGCGRQFDSRGLRCCSTDCERHYREREDNAALMAEVDMQPPAPKRKCQHCGGDIPNWRKGRRVTKAARFCSDSCSGKAKRLPKGR